MCIRTSLRLVRALCGVHKRLGRRLWPIGVNSVPAGTLVILRIPGELRFRPVYRTLSSYYKETLAVHQDTFATFVCFYWAGALGLRCTWIGFLHKRTFHLPMHTADFKQQPASTVWRFTEHCVILDSRHPRKRTCSHLQSHRGTKRNGCLS